MNFTIQFFLRIRIIFFLSTFYIFNPCIAQSADHKYKLEGGNFKLQKYKTENGKQVLDRYEKDYSTIEKNDSILYVEFYVRKKQWNIYRYKLLNGKAAIDGWQKEFDANGILSIEKYCTSEKRKCKLTRSYSYYPDSQLMSSVSYYGDKSEGLHFYFYNNGQMRECLEYENNKLQNVLAYYDANGNVLDPGDFCNGEGFINIYSMNGKLIQIKEFHKGKVKKVYSIENTMK